MSLTQAQLFDHQRRDISEKAFQKAIENALDREGWWWMHVRAMRTPDGRWLTGTSKPGFPDLFAVRPGFILGLEVKARNGHLKPDQRECLTELYEGGALAWVCRPNHDWEELARWIHDPATAPRKSGW
jgi:VRR-NUC domain